MKILIIFGMVMSIVIIFNIFHQLNKWLKYKEKQLKLEQYKVNVNTNINNNIEDRLDTIIESAFQEYTLLNLIYKSDWYITEKEESNIQKDIAHLVADRLSPVMLQQLSLYYNEDAIMDVISKRVFFKVTNFVIEHNNGTGI